MKATLKEFERIAQVIKASHIDVTTLPEHDVISYRQAMLVIGKASSDAVKSTALKSHDYDDNKVIAYIQKVLLDGFNLEATKLSSNTYMEDAQHLTRYKHLIKACVIDSSFSKAQFKIKPLRYQRSAIERSNTIHELRQNINAIIGPLKWYRESIIVDVLNDDDYFINIDCLVAENESLKSMLSERNRMLEEIMHIYNEPLKEKTDRLSMLQRIDAFKVEHNATDKQACKVFDVSRSSVTRMRKGAV